MHSKSPCGLFFKLILDFHIFISQIQNDNVISETFASQDRNWLLSKPQSALNCFKNTLLTHGCPIQIPKIIQEGFLWIIIVNFREKVLF